MILVGKIGKERADGVWIARLSYGWESSLHARQGTAKRAPQWGQELKGGKESLEKSPRAPYHPPDSYPTT